MPNGFDPTVINRIQPAASPLDVVFVGRLIAEKRVDLLIHAVSQLAVAGEPVRCLIVGDGPERKRLTALTRSLNITGHVTFTGALPSGDDVFAAMKAASVLVLPIVREGFGMVALEANACGIPVITTDHPCNAAADLVEQGHNGWVVPATAGALAAAISQALSLSPAERDSTHIVRHTRRYSWQKLAGDHALTELYSPAPPSAAVTIPAQPATSANVAATFGLPDRQERSACSAL
jgi:glycosyltransferase involved in cell wall biosynthesis